MFLQEDNDYRIDESFPAAVKCLRRAFRLPHSTLRLGISVKPGDPAGTAPKSFCVLLRGLFINYDGEPAFGNTKRLVFRFWFRRDEPTKAINGICSTMTWVLGSSKFARGERRWVAARPDEGGRVLWLCGFDAEDGLPEVRGIVPKYGIRAVFDS
jgi:hypothetical protein